MSRVWYGSLENRLEENKQFVKEIKVGDGVTEYFYSDREPYEVVAVKDQKHITIRRLDAKRIDHNGMSECQEYAYASNEQYPEIEIAKRGAYWYSVAKMDADDLARVDAIRAKDNTTTDDINFLLWAARFDHDVVRAKGQQVRYSRMNISIGRAEKYYDPCF